MTEKILPGIALRGLTVLPSMSIHVDLAREKSIRSAAKALEQEQLVFLVTQRDSEKNEPEKEDLFRVGVVAKILRTLKLPNQMTRIMVKGLYRAELQEIVTSEQMMLMRVAAIEPELADRLEKEAMLRVLQELLRTYLHGNPKADREIQELVSDNIDLEVLMDQIAGAMPFRMAARQEFLERDSLQERYAFLGTLMSDENEILRIRQEFQKEVKTRIDKNQRDYILREQLHLLHEELGDTPDPEEENQRYQKQLEELTASDQVKECIRKEIRRFRSLPPGGQETSVARNYIETLLEMPWDKATEENIDLKGASDKLEQDHYGLEKVKERVLEYLAVRKLCLESGNKDDAPILCLVGPPGTGKTSIARSVAAALNKKYVRICLGGVHDEAEIRGHRRTYVGSMPGRIAEGIRQAGVKNPLMLLDEIDKVSSDYKGDVSSALLEVLDPEQNIHFRDHYLELPLDLSETLFIATANTTDTIPRPLLDRMELIQVSSYTENEKFHIGKKYLVPKQVQRNGLPEKSFAISDGALRKLIRSYTRESGVRGLERQIGALCRKTARILLENQSGQVRVKKTDLETYLGKELYHYEDALPEPEVGIVRGLAWTSVGGDTLEIEVNVMPGKGELELTGQLGDVMKESAMAALTYVRSVSEEAGVEEDYYEKHDLHIHIPEGAVPKDGPSAGITIATAVYSAVTGRKVRSDTAMTGEITLRGRVMPIGGLKEKLLAAKMAHLKQVLVPEDNQADVWELSKEITDGLEICFVKNMEQVLKGALL